MGFFLLAAKGVGALLSLVKRLIFPLSIFSMFGGPSDAVSGLTSKAAASLTPSLAPKLAAEPPREALSACGDVDEEEDDEEYEDMFVKTSFGGSIEWGGPLRGGRMPEPTRFGDWERKGRCTDW